MNDEIVCAEAEEERPRPSSLLSTFEEIAQTTAVRLISE